MKELKTFLHSWPALIVSMFLLFPVFASALQQPEWPDVEHVIGFDGVPAKLRGTLLIQDRNIAFYADKRWKTVRIDRIRSAQVGYERQETGGALGKVTRVAIPYGGGSLLGLATQRSVGLLTIQYQDSSEGVHEAVFLMPKDAASAANEAIAARIHPLPGPAAQDPCLPKPPTSPIIRIKLTNSGGIPAEYEALIYEHLMSDIESRWPQAIILRGTYAQPSCKVATVSVDLVDAKSGNAVARTASGPIGMFVGVTQVRAEVVLQNSNGEQLWQHDYKASRRGDRESLGAATSIASDIGRDLKKSNWLQDHPFHGE